MPLPCAKHEVVCVTWLDAVGQSSRHTAEEVAKIRLAVNRNLGWIVDQDDERLVLAHGDSTSGEIDCFVIPRVCLRSVEYICPRRRKPKSQGGSDKTDAQRTA